MRYQYYQTRCPRRYGFWFFAFDCFMTFCTCGLWFVYLVYRKLRGR